MRITIIPSDKSIGIDGNFYSINQEDLSWIPSEVHAVQWYDTWGEIEYKDGTPNERIENLGIFEQAIETHQNTIKKIQEEEEQLRKERELARDYWEELRILRNLRLSECDWTQIGDVTLSDEQKIAWQSYRQALRDLPENITDPKPLVIDEFNPNWPIKP